MSWDTAPLGLPGERGITKPVKACDKGCSNTNPHAGVDLPNGKWRCARCWRTPLRAHAKKR